MKHSILISAAILLGLSLPSCKKDNSYNASSNQPQVQYRVTASNTNYNLARTTATTGLVWTAGLAFPDAIKFEAKKDNLEVEYKSTNNTVVDLMSPTEFDFGGFTLPAGTYDEIEISIDLDKHGADPSLQLTGQVTNGIVTLPVSVQVSENVTLTTEQHDVTIANGDIFVVATTLDMLVITDGITADMLLNAQLTNGTVVISKDANKDLYRIIVDNLKNKHHHCEFEHHHH